MLGAPLTHDFAVVSLSRPHDSLGDHRKSPAPGGPGGPVLCLYNPLQPEPGLTHLQRACDILLEEKSQIPCAAMSATSARAGEEAHTCTPPSCRGTQVDMFTTVFVGNQQTCLIGGKMVAPRGYLQRGCEMEVLLFGTTGGARSWPCGWPSRTAPGDRLCGHRLQGPPLRGGGDRGPHRTAGRSREMEELMKSRPFCCVADATHPMPYRSPPEIRACCEKLDLPYRRIVPRGRGRGTSCAASLTDAAKLCAGNCPGTILLTTGSKGSLGLPSPSQGCGSGCYPRVLPSMSPLLEACQAAGFPETDHRHAGALRRELNRSRDPRAGYLRCW